MGLKIVIGDPKTSTSKQVEVSDDVFATLQGKRIGAKVSGKDLGLAEDYAFEITGGSDSSGFPMRRDIASVSKKKIFAYKGVGITPQRKGVKQRKTVAGTIIGKQTAQLNVKITTHGKSALFEEPKTETAENAA